MLLLWGLLLCQGLLPQAQGEAQHLLHLRISNSQLETVISDLFSEHRILDRLVSLPVTGAMSESVAVLDHLPFVRKGLSKKSSGLDLSLAGDLLSGRSLPLLRGLLQAGGLVVEDAKGPEVTLQILSDSLLQVTLRCKLYLSLQEILRLKVIKNIRIGVRLEHTGNKTKVAFEECHSPPGYLSIEVLEQMDSLLVNRVLKLVTSVLDEALPFLLQKTVCPLATTLLNLLLEDLLQIILPPASSGPEDFQYCVTTTELTKEAILMTVQLVTPCSPGQRAPRPERLAPQPLPRLAQGSMADLVFGLQVYNDILSCLYTSTETPVDPQDPTASDLVRLLSLGELEPGPKGSRQSRGSIGLTINSPDPPTVRLDGHTAMVVQPGSLVLLGPSDTSSVPVSWKLFSEAVFSSRNQDLIIQFAPNSTTVTLGPYPAGIEKQEGRLKAFLLELLQRVFLPRHNELLREHHLPLPSIKGVSFDQARVDLSEDYLLLTVPEE
ncbi:BPI fold-containing family B member 4-like [Eulemur rufifrons]|uniref:BPI fold-containing family B member 4-like n=1 Tax=Eulemur rufifrons TaxID=859984 RepID=UPI0037421C35